MVDGTSSVGGESGDFPESFSKPLSPYTLQKSNPERSRSATVKGGQLRREEEKRRDIEDKDQRERNEDIQKTPIRQSQPRGLKANHLKAKYKEPHKLKISVPVTPEPQITKTEATSPIHHAEPGKKEVSPEPEIITESSSQEASLSTGERSPRPYGFAPAKSLFIGKKMYSGWEIIL